MMNCRNCDTIITGQFCHHCGRPIQIARVDWHYVVHEIQHVVHFEKGLAHTVKELLRNPGPSIHTFITVDRSRLVKPVLFLVVTSLIYSTIDHFFHLEQGYIEYSAAKDSISGQILQWIQNHYGYASIIMSLFIAGWLKIIYRAHDYNLFEVLILLCFVLGMGMLILAVFAMFEGLTGLPAMTLSGVVSVVYCTWAIGHFFDRERVASYFKALAAYMLGMATFSVLVIALGLLADFLKSRLS